MLEVFKEFSFEASHSLPHLPEGHKCRRLHGHSYKVHVSVRGDVDPVTRFVVDYADIGDAWSPLYAMLDHHFVNEIPGLEISTSEALAEWIYRRLKVKLPGLYSVTVRETATAGCTYCDDRPKDATDVEILLDEKYPTRHLPQLVGRDGLPK